MYPLTQSTGFVVEEMDEEILLYHPNTHKAIHLNRTAAVIWKLCDGKRTVKELTECLAAEFPSAKLNIAHEVQEAIDQLLHDGALIEQSAESTS